MTINPDNNRKKNIRYIILFGVQTFLSISVFNYFQSYILTFLLVGLLALSFYFMFKAKSKKLKWIALIPFIGILLLAMIINPNAWPTWTTEIILFCSILWGLHQFPKITTTLTSLLIAGSAIAGFFYYINVIYPKYHTAVQSHFFVNESIDKAGFEKLKVEGMDGENYQLNHLINNKVALIDFSFIECAPCRAKEPSLDSLTNYFKNDTNVVILRIVDGKISSKANFIKYNTEVAPLFKEYYDSAGIVSSFFLKDNSYPTDFIVYKGKKIMSTSQGFSTNKSQNNSYSNGYIQIIKKEINELLNAKK